MGRERGECGHRFFAAGGCLHSACLLALRSTVARESDHSCDGAYQFIMEGCGLRLCLPVVNPSFPDESLLQPNQKRLV